MNTVIWFGIGAVAGIILFFFCAFMGWIDKWSGLKK